MSLPPASTLPVDVINYVVTMWCIATFCIRYLLKLLYIIFYYEVFQCIFARSILISAGKKYISIAFFFVLSWQQLGIFIFIYLTRCNLILKEEPVFNDNFGWFVSSFFILFYSLLSLTATTILLRVTVASLEVPGSRQRVTFFLYACCPCLRGCWITSLQ